MSVRRDHGSPEAIPLDKQGRLGEVAAGCRIARDCLAIFGWLSEPLPREGKVILSDGPEQGRFHTFSWSRQGDPATSWFLALLLFDDIELLKPGQTILLQGNGSRRQALAKVPKELSDRAAFLERIQPHLGNQAVAAATFLVEGMGQGALGQGPGARFLGDFLVAFGEQDGAIEIRGTTPSGELFLQGWSSHLPKGECPLLIEADGLWRHVGRFASFARADVAAPAIGVAGVLATSGRVEPAKVQRVFHLGGNRIRRLDVYAGGTVLSPGDCAVHLRDAAPLFHGDAAALDALRRATRQRYQGRETLSEVDGSIRIAIDLAARIPEIGYYLTGWLLDPHGRILSVSLKHGSEFAQRLDDRWTRVPRPDVTDVFRSDQRFTAHLGDDHRHGFTVFLGAPGMPPADGQYLEIDLGEHGLAFVPVGFAADAPSSLRRKLLGSVDLHKPTAPELVERHLGPLFLALGDSPAWRDSPQPQAERDQRPGAERRAIIVALPERDPGGALAFVARTGLQGLGEDDMLYLVLRQPDATLEAQLRRQIAFYEVGARLIAPSHPVDAVQAYEIAVGATAAPELLLMSASVFALEPGWVTRLAAALAADPRAAPACPTILYEDESVKFAGIDRIEPSDGAFPVVSVRRHAGYPRQRIAGEKTRPSYIGTLDCCLIRREAIVSAGGLGGAMTQPALRAMDFLLRVATRAGRTLWVPDAIVYDLAAEPAGNEPMPYWAQTAGFVDAWTFRHIWNQQIERRRA